MSERGRVLVRVLTFDLMLADARNLKEKRMVLRSMKDRLRQRFNAAVLETDYQDLWNRAQLSVAFLASDGAAADRMSEHVDRFLDESGRATILDVRTDTYSG